MLFKQSHCTHTHTRARPKTFSVLDFGTEKVELHLHLFKYATKCGLRKGDTCNINNILQPNQANVTDALANRAQLPFM